MPARRSASSAPPHREDDRFGARPGQDLSQIERHGVLVLDNAVQMPNEATPGAASSTVAANLAVIVMNIMLTPLIA